MQTFREGKLKERVDILDSQIPDEGPCDKDRPKLEDWRKLSNAYYRYYNDGDKFVAKLRHIAKRHDRKIEDRPRSLERLADAVFAAAWTEYKQQKNG